MGVLRGMDRLELVGGWPCEFGRLEGADSDVEESVGVDRFDSGDTLPVLADCAFI